jgi:flagellar hook assembly protein FlgD
VPNPFNPQTTIRYELPTAGPARLAVHDVAGRLVRVLADDKSREAGRFEAVWDGRNGSGVESATGVYFCRLQAGEPVLVRKMTLIR